MRPPSAVVAAALCLLILAGCTPAPSPSPTYWCTPEAGGTSHRCNEADYRAMQAKDKLYAEAEAVYRRYFAEKVRVYEIGGLATATSSLKSAMAPSALAESMKVFRELHDRGAVVAGAPRLESVERAPGAWKAGSDVSLSTCVDGSGVRIAYKDGTATRGSVFIERVYLGQDSDQLKIVALEWKAAASC